MSNQNKSCALFIGSAANFTKSSLDYNAVENLLCYGSCNRLIIYDSNFGCSIGTESDRIESFVTCVKWARGRRGCPTNYILCCTADGNARVFLFKPPVVNAYIQQLLTCLLKIEAHTSSINSCDAFFISKDKLIFITTSSDCAIKGWEFSPSSESLKELFTWSLPGRSLALELRLITDIPGCVESSYLVVYGGDDSNLHILFPVTNENTLQLIAKLKGHEDWILSIDFFVEDTGDIVLASGSKDGTIRLWHLTSSCVKKPDDELQVNAMKIELPRMDTEGATILFCSLESVLRGHEGLVSDIAWSHEEKGDVLNSTPLLLSCSKTEDRSVVLWGEQDGLWVERLRLGEVGGNREGYFVARFVDRGKGVVAVNYQGGLHKWIEENCVWLAKAMPSGHFGEVVDLDWDASGRFLMTASKDQTTRIFTSCLQDKKKLWREIARPQVHGYDMSCIARLSGFQFVSGAEEKVLRGFSPTGNFISLLKSLHGGTPIEEGELSFPTKATVPSLGLSNKGLDISSNDVQAKLEELNRNNSPGGPTTEDNLILDSLWPEVSKLYGHGNELLALVSSSCGQVIASSCRANNETDASVILWNAIEWKRLNSLSFHRLSVTQMEFSSEDNFLLSVSRDRSWAVARISMDGTVTGKMTSASCPKSSHHSRIIWSCAWVPDSLRFVTASRDKTVALWRPLSPHKSEGGASREGEGEMPSWEREAVSVESDEVTAVAVANYPSSSLLEGFIMAIGLVSGEVVLRRFDPKRHCFVHLMSLEPCHRKTVRRLKFKPYGMESQDSESLILASCGNDNAVIIYQIKL